MIIGPPMGDGHRLLLKIRFGRGVRTKIVFLPGCTFSFMTSRPVFGYPGYPIRYSSILQILMTGLLALLYSI